MPRHKETGAADELAILSAVWILACNDENPIITYRGLRLRLELEKDFDIEGLVRKHGELFRVRGGAISLKKWQDQMLQGQRMPSWIAEIPSQQERNSLISGLATRDIFRSQFRSNVASTGRSPTEVIEWGLKHIERLAKAADEARETPWKRLGAVWIPVLSAFIAIAALVATTVQQIRSQQVEKQIRQFEAVAVNKNEAYSTFMSNLVESYANAMSGHAEMMRTNLQKSEGAFYRFQPYLARDEQEATWKKYNEGLQILEVIQTERTAKGNAPTSGHEEFPDLLDYFRTTLFNELFK